MARIDVLVRRAARRTAMMHALKRVKNKSSIWIGRMRRCKKSNPETYALVKELRDCSEIRIANFKKALAQVPTKRSATPRLTAFPEIFPGEMLEMINCAIFLSEYAMKLKLESRRYLKLHRRPGVDLDGPLAKSLATLAYRLDESIAGVYTEEAGK